MIKALIFDLDGVITDTAKYHFLAWKELARGLGFDFTEKDNERLKGVSRMDSLEILLEIGGQSFDDETKEHFANQKNKRYVEYISKMTPQEILPGVKDILTEARNKKLKIALGSASKNALTILKQINLKSYFDIIIDGTKVHKAKPDPEVFLKGARGLNVLPDECIVFEDAEAGIEAALNGGFHAIGIGTDLNFKKADLIIPGFSNITINEIIEKF